MVVITLTDCPPKLRGDLTKWMYEIDTGVYVGYFSARVREKLWERVCEYVKNGRATMVYNAQNEQHISFRVHNSKWKPVEYDGITLMMRPNNEQDIPEEEGFSKASKIQKAKFFQESKLNRSRQGVNGSKDSEYIVIDIETTGLDPQRDEITEMAALKVAGGEVVNSFSSLVRCDKKISKEVSRLTGITDDLLEKSGRDLKTVLIEFLDFIADKSLVCHNRKFDYEFIRIACKNCGLEQLSNPCVDTLHLAKRKVDGILDYKLGTLADYFSIPIEELHRALQDCYVTYYVYEKLKGI